MSYNFTPLPDWEVYNDSFIEAKFLGASCNLSVWYNFTSSSRGTMWSASHSGQMPVVMGTTPRKINAGIEHEYGKYHSGDVMTESGEVYAVIPKYRNLPSGARTPSMLMIYHSSETGEYNARELKRFKSDHPTFGYKLYPNDTVNVSPGSSIGKGQTIAASSNVKKNEYHFGIEANVAFASHAVCIEDGIGVYIPWAKRLCTDIITKRTLSFDKFTVPKNIFGDRNTYRAYLGLGEQAPSNGIIASTREINSEFAFLEMSKNALGTDLTTDRSIHVPPESEVLDISAFEGRVPRNSQLPSAITQQADEDVKVQSDYFTEVRNTYNALRRLRGDGVKLGHEFHRQIVRAISDDPNAVQGHRIKRTYRRNVIKNYRIDFELVSNLKARIGHKLTDLHGGKAIVVHLIEEKDKSFDKFGTVIDIFIDPLTTNDRMNPGRFYEQYFNAYSDQVIRKIKPLRPSDAFKMLMDYYRILSPFQYNLVGGTCAGDDVKEFNHVDWVKRHGIEVTMPQNTKDMGPEQVNRLENWEPLDYGPIEYTDLAGNRQLTYDDIIVGSIYVVMLEKIGDDWSTSSVSTNTHFGLPSKINYIDKHSNPVRNQAVRILGESEIRIMLAYMKPEVVKTLLMLSSNPSVTRHAVNAILDYDGNSGAIDDLKIDMNELNENRAVQYIRQVMYCYGAVLE